MKPFYYLRDFFNDILLGYLVIILLRSVFYVVLHLKYTFQYNIISILIDLIEGYFYIIFAKLICFLIQSYELRGLRGH